MVKLLGSLLNTRGLKIASARGKNYHVEETRI